MNKKTNFDFSKRGIFEAIKILLLFCGIIFGATAEARAAGVTLTATPASNTAAVGQAASYTIKINRDSYTDKVTLSASGLPAGVTATFTPNVTTALSSTLKLQTSASTPIGTFNITIKGTANAITIAPLTIKLTTTPAQSVSISIVQDAPAVGLYEEFPVDINITRTNFDGAVTLSAENVPQGMTVRFEPKTTTGNSAKMYIYSTRQSFFTNQSNLYVSAASATTQILLTRKLMAVYVNCGTVWVEQFGVPDAGGTVERCRHPDPNFPSLIGCPEFAADVTYDASGNVYVAGYVREQDGSQQVWAAKFDAADGRRLWTRRLPAQSREETPTDIAVDAAGNIYVGGYALFTTVGGDADYDLFLAKFSGSDGNLISHAYFGSGGEDGSGGMVITFNGAGNAVLTAVTDIHRLHLRAAYFEVDFDVERFTFDANFNMTRTVLVSDVTPFNPRDIAFSGDGSFYVGGQDMDGSTNHNHVLLYKFNAQGQKLWQWTGVSGGQSFGTIKRLATDSNGNVWALINSGADGLYKIDSNNTGTDIIANIVGINNSLTLDANDNVYAAGLSNSSVANFNVDFISELMTRPDAIFSKLDAAGNLVFVRQFAAGDKDEISSIKVNSAGNVLLVGSTVNFKGNSGFEDPLVMRYALVGIGSSDPKQSNGRYFLNPIINGFNPNPVRNNSSFTINGGNFFGFNSPLVSTPNAHLKRDSSVYHYGKYYRINSVSPTGNQINVQVNNNNAVGYGDRVWLTERCRSFDSGTNGLLNVVQ